MIRLILRSTTLRRSNVGTNFVQNFRCPKALKSLKIENMKTSLLSLLTNAVIGNPASKVSYKPEWKLMKSWGNLKGP